MPEHTQGPWSIYDDSDPYHIKVKGQIPPHGGAHVADVLLPENAHLISAAPDMLTVLKQIQFGFNHARCPACGGFDGESENDRAHSQSCPVAAAIAKAEGRA